MIEQNNNSGANLSSTKSLGHKLHTVFMWQTVMALLAAALLYISVHHCRTMSTSIIFIDTKNTPQETDRSAVHKIIYLYSTPPQVSRYYQQLREKDQNYET